MDDKPEAMTAPELDEKTRMNRIAAVVRAIPLLRKSFSLQASGPAPSGTMQAQPPLPWAEKENA